MPATDTGSATAPNGQSTSRAQSPHKTEKQWREGVELRLKRATLFHVRLHNDRDFLLDVLEAAADRIAELETGEAQ